MLCTNQVSEEGKERRVAVSEEMEDAEERRRRLPDVRACADTWMARRLKIELAPREGWENQPPPR
jgi:hypothetical protein